MFMFFQNRSWRLFLECAGADFASTDQLWYHFRFSEFQQVDFRATFFVQNVDWEPCGGRGLKGFGATLLCPKPLNYYAVGTYWFVKGNFWDGGFTELIHDKDYVTYGVASSVPRLSVRVR